MAKPEAKPEAKPAAQPNRKPKKKPGDLDSEIKALKSSKATVEADLSAKINEAQKLVDSETIDLLSALKDQIRSSVFEIIQGPNEVTFSMTFKRSDITARPDANTALANIQAYAKAAGLETIKGVK